MPVAALDGWTFLHEFRDSTSDEYRPRQPRVVMVDLLGRDSPEWLRTGLDADEVILETKSLIHLQSVIGRPYT